MAALDAATLAKEGVITKSLRISYVTPGDVIYVPFGALVLEKALGTRCMGLRVPLTLIAPDQTLPAQLLIKASQASSAKGPETIGCNYHCSNSWALEYSGLVG